MRRSNMGAHICDVWITLIHSVRGLGMCSRGLLCGILNVLTGGDMRRSMGWLPIVGSL